MTNEEIQAKIAAVSSAFDVQKAKKELADAQSSECWNEMMRLQGENRALSAMLPALPNTDANTIDTGMIDGLLAGGKEPVEGEVIDDNPSKEEK